MPQSSVEHRPPLPQSNAGATAETGEPGIGGRTSVWWKWTAPFTAKTIFDTEGSDFDTVLSVYTGSTLTNLTLISEDDDLGEAGASRVVFDAIQDSVYYVAVHSFSNQTGNIRLSWSNGPSSWVVTTFRMAQTNQVSAFEIDQLWRLTHPTLSPLSQASRAILDQQRQIILDNAIRLKQIRREILQFQQEAARTAALKPLRQIALDRLRLQSQEVSSAINEGYRRVCGVAAQEQVFLPPCIPPLCVICPPPPLPPTVSSQSADSETTTLPATIQMAASQAVQQMILEAISYWNYAARLGRIISRSQAPPPLQAFLLQKTAANQSEAGAIGSAALYLQALLPWDQGGNVTLNVILPNFSSLEKRLTELRLNTLELAQEVQSAGIPTSPFSAPPSSVPVTVSRLTAVLKWTFSSTGLDLVNLEHIAFDVLAVANLFLADLQEVEDAVRAIGFLPPETRAIILTRLQFHAQSITQQRLATAAVREQLREMEQEFLADDSPNAGQLTRLNALQTDLSQTTQSITARFDDFKSLLVELLPILPDLHLSAATLSLTPVVPAFTSSLRFDGMTDRVRAGEETAVMLGLDPAYPGVISGKLTVKLRPGVTSTDNDPAVRFSSGHQAVEFTVRAGTSRAQFGDGTASIKFGAGTVAGDIVLHATLQSDGLDLTPLPAPARSLALAVGPPSIGDVRVVLQTPTNFEVSVSGFSTPREVTTATFAFAPGSGVMFENARLDINVQADFIRWYSSGESKPHGSRFTLTMPFTMQNSTTDMIHSVSVTLRNRFGDSETVTRSFF